MWAVSWHSSGTHSRGSPYSEVVMKSLTASDGPPRTAAELAREKKLRDDPMAVVHGPLFVTCKRCGSRIKLSPKSSFDPFHWMKHRERCLRKPIGLARATRRSLKGIYTSPAKKSPASSSNTDGDNATPPPLTPDDDHTTSSDIFKERSPSPNIDDLDRSTTPVVRELDSAFVDYLHRSFTKHFPLVDRWQTWNWSELRSPTWMGNHDINLGLVRDELEVWDDGRDDSPFDPVELRHRVSRLTQPATRNQDTPLSV